MTLSMLFSSHQSKNDQDWMSERKRLYVIYLNLHLHKESACPLDEDFEFEQGARQVLLM